MGRQYSSLIEQRQSMIPEFILNSFLRSPKFYEYKLYFFKKYFTCFKVQQIQSLIEWLKQSYETKEVSDLPALYQLNPIKTTLLLVEMLRIVRAKFKSL